MAGFLSVILRFLRLGRYGFEKSEDKVLERVLERRDYRYIMEIGVPRVEAPRLPPAGRLPGRPYVASGASIGSMLLGDPEALMYILRSAEGRGDMLRLKGSGGDVLRGIADYTRKRGGTYYFDAVLGGIELRVLASQGLITGIYLVRGGAGIGGERASTRLRLRVSMI